MKRREFFARRARPLTRLARLGPGHWPWLVPNAALIMFVVAMGALLWLLHRHEADMQRASLARDIQWAEGTVKRQLEADQAFIDSLAREQARGTLTREVFENRAMQYHRQHTSIVDITWNPRDLDFRWNLPVAAPERPPHRQRAPFAEQERMMRLTAATGRPTYTEVYAGYEGQSYIEYHSPVVRGDRMLGTVAAIYSIEGIIQNLLPPGFREKYRVGVTDSSGAEILAYSPQERAGNEYLTQSTALALPWRGLKLKATSYRTESSLAQNMLVGVIVALTVLIVWSLWALSRHIKSRLEAEAERDRFYNLSLDLVCIVGTDGRLKRVNPAFERLLGYSAETLLATPFTEFIHPDDRVTSREAMARAKDRAGTITFETRCRAADGSWKWLYWAVNPAPKEGLVFAVATDITERKLAELRIMESNERFVTTLDGLEISVYVTGLDSGALLFANNHFRRSFPGLTLEQPVRTFEESFEPALSTRFAREQLLDTGGQPAGAPKEEVQRREDGHWYRVRARAMRWVDGQLVRVLSMGDITERKQAEELARQQQEKLLLTARLMTVGEMASTLAHELNQPLAAIANYNMGCVRRLRSGQWKPEELLAAMEKASAQAERAGAIIQRVRDFVRKREPNRTGIDLNEVIADVLRLTELDAEMDHIRLRLDLARGLPSVVADRIMIEQVILNLVKNGIEAMRETERRSRVLTISTAPGAAGGVEVAVHDRGHGISAEVEEALFSPFFTTKAQGMGMGLNICRSIIEFHDGRLWFTPNLSGGSTFRFTLPAQN